MTLRSAASRARASGGVRPGGGVDLDRPRVELVGLLDLLELGVHEQADLDPGLLQRLHHGPDLDAVEHHVEAALGRQLLAPLGHEGHLVGLHGEGDPRHLLGRRHLHVEAGAHGLPQHLDVAVLDVPPVAAQVHGDPVGAPQLGEHRRVHGVGLLRPPRLADGGHVVDVHAETQHRTASISRVSFRGASSAPGDEESAGGCPYIVGAATDAAAKSADKETDIRPARTADLPEMVGVALDKRSDMSTDKRSWATSWPAAPSFWLDRGGLLMTGPRRRLRRGRDRAAGDQGDALGERADARPATPRDGLRGASVLRAPGDELLRPELAHLAGEGDLVALHRALVLDADRAAHGVERLDEGDLVPDELALQELGLALPAHSLEEAPSP